MLTFDQRNEIIEYDDTFVKNIAVACDSTLIQYTSPTGIHIYDKNIEVILEPFIYTSPVIFFIT